MKRFLYGLFATAFLICCLGRAYGAEVPGTLRWSYPGGGYSFAIGTDGTIYSGTSSDDLYAINPDGTLKWRVAAGGGYSLAIGTDGTIYSETSDDNLYAINPDGTLKWSYPGGGSALAIGTDGTIYSVASDDNLYAINPDGTLKWSYAIEVDGSSPAIGADGTIYVGFSDGFSYRYLYAINPDGTLKWHNTTGGGSALAIGADGIIYSGSWTGSLSAVDFDGTFKWSYYTGRCNDPAIGADGTIYVGEGGPMSAAYDPGLFAINPDGTLKWFYSTPVLTGQIFRSPAIGADGTIYAVTSGDDLYAINPDGTLKWSYAAEGFSSLAIGADGTIYVGTGGQVYAIYSSSSGPADSAWPMFQHDIKCTGRAPYITPGLAITRSGTGSGTVTSEPSGINCGSSCIAHYSQDTEVVLTATPADGSVFTGWSGGGCSGTGTCTVVVSDSITTITAVFTRKPILTLKKSGTGSGTVVSSPSGISCGTTCSEKFAPGTQVTLTATPATGSTFTGWSGAGCSGAGTCTFGINENVTVTATFTINKHVVTATMTGTGSGTLSATGLSCSGKTCSGTYSYGVWVNITATPLSGSAFTGFSSCDATSGNTCTVIVSGNKSVSAGFTSMAASNTLTVIKSGSGTVTSSPGGISCGLTCQASFTQGTAVTLTAVPASGFVFAYWLGACSGTSAACKIVMNNDTAVTAMFDPLQTKQYKLTIVKKRVKAGDGIVKSTDEAINCGSICSKLFYKDSPVSLSATPDSGSVFAGWDGACSGTGTCDVTMEKAETVRATFVGPQKLTVRKQKIGKGDGTVTSSPEGIDCGTACSALFPYAGQVTLTAVPVAGSSFIEWKPASLGCTGNPCTVTMEKAKTATAAFKKNKGAGNDDLGVEVTDMETDME